MRTLGRSAHPARVETVNNGDREIRSGPHHLHTARGISHDAQRKTAKRAAVLNSAERDQSPAAVIDLQARFGSRYRVTYEADGRTRGAWGDEQAWLLELRCRYGLVYPFGGDILAAYSDHPRVAARLRSLPFILTARGDEEVVITFHVNDVAAVLKVLRPHSRRQLSPAQRAHSAATLARARQKRREALRQRAFPALESTQRGHRELPPQLDALRAFEPPEAVVSHEQGGERR